MGQRIMAWSKCDIEIGKTGSNDAMSTTLTNIGTIKDKSSSLEATDGEVLEIKGEGGETADKEQLEGGFTAKARVIEPDDTLLTLLGLGQAGEAGSDEYDVTTHVVSEYFSAKITPKNVGAVGIKAPKCSIKAKPGWSTAEGHYLDLEFEILKTSGANPKWYTRFKKKTSGSTGS